MTRLSSPVCSNARQPNGITCTCSRRTAFRINAQRQQFTFVVGLKPMCIKVCKACQTCRMLKKNNKNYGDFPPKKEPESIPWHTLHVDLIGPYCFRIKDKKRIINTYMELWCITMIDPATGWYEIAEIPTKQADFIANLLKFYLLTCYPWPTKICMVQGGEFKAKVAAALKDEYGSTTKKITTRNPQSNSIIKLIHQVVL
jgi:hypothetical protein